MGRPRRLLPAALGGAALVSLLCAGRAFLASPAPLGLGAEGGVVALRGLTPRGLIPASAAAGSKPSPSSSAPSAASSLLVGGLALAAALAARAAGRSWGRGDLVLRRQSLFTRPDQATPWWNRMTKWRVESGPGIWAEKLNSTLVFEELGGNVKWTKGSVLVVKRGGNVVTNKYWPEKHGKYSIQVGYERFVPEEWELKTRRNLAIQQLARCELPPLRKLKEFRLRPQDWAKFEIGQKIWPSDIFQEGDRVDVWGKTRERGFLGAIKRHGHQRGPMTHGSKHHRRYGSVGGTTSTARVFPLKKMPGHVGGKGNKRIGLRILKIIDRIDEDNMPESIIIIDGPIPGVQAYGDQGGSYVYLHKTANTNDGRYMQDPIYMWYSKKGEGEDPFVPINHNVWSHKTYWGRDYRWMKQEQKKYWPDGFPGYDNAGDPFYDDCDPHYALKVPEW